MRSRQIQDTAIKEVNIIDLDADELMRLIDEGERFYVNTGSESDILSTVTPTSDRDAFWFYETPVAKQPIRLTVTKSHAKDVNKV